MILPLPLRRNRLAARTASFELWHSLKVFKISRSLELPFIFLVSSQSLMILRPRECDKVHLMLGHHLLKSRTQVKLKSQISGSSNLWQNLWQNKT